MRFLRANTAQILTVGPFYDATDGKTIETALTITNERITLTADTYAGSAPTNILDNVTGATSGTANDLNYITGNDAGFMQLELAAANLTTYGFMLLSITDAANHLPVYHELMVLPEPVFDSFFPAAAGNPLPVFGIVDWGTAQASASGTLVHRSGLSLADDILNGGVEYVYSGTGAGQRRVIDDFVGATDTTTVTPAWTAPSTDSLYLTFAGAPASTGVIPPVNATQFAGQTITAAAGVTLPSSVASPTNITAGTITTVTNLTNAPTAGDLTSTMKASIFTTALTEAYAADGAAGTLSQILFSIQAFLQERAVSGTTLTVKKLDGSTTAMTFTLGDATAPTTVTRAT